MKDVGNFAVGYANSLVSCQPVDLYLLVVSIPLKYYMQPSPPIFISIQRGPDIFSSHCYDISSPRSILKPMLPQISVCSFL